MGAARPGAATRLNAPKGSFTPRGRARCQVPAWVPVGLEAEYREVALREGEEDAARHCRRLKREMARP